MKEAKLNFKFQCIYIKVVPAMHTSQVHKKIQKPF